MVARPCRAVIPVHLPSPNVRQMPRTAARRVKTLRAMIGWHLLSQLGLSRPRLPVVVTLTRVSPRVLDAHDNLRGACKPAVDEVAAYLGLSSDASPWVTWEYRQQRGKGFALVVEVAPRLEGAVRAD